MWHATSKKLVFNCDLAKSVENTHVRDFTEVMLDYNFCSLINKPTRITDTGATVLDHQHNL